MLSLAVMKVIVANWKAYPLTFKESKSLFELCKKLFTSSKFALIVAPPVLHLAPLKALYRGRRISFAGVLSGACGGERACTGAVLPMQLADLNVNFAIIGHSEQREMGLEDSEIALQVKMCADAGVVPIVVVGERKRVQDASHFKFVKKQLKEAFKLYPKNKALRAIIAYEPVWAIGGKKSLTVRDIELMSIYIKKTMMEISGRKSASEIAVLYGGSVNEHNVKMIMDIDSIAGVLVGSVSANKEEFSNLYEALHRH